MATTRSISNNVKLLGVSSEPLFQAFTDGLGVSPQQNNTSDEQKRAQDTPEWVVPYAIEKYIPEH